MRKPKGMEFKRQAPTVGITAAGPSKEFAAAHQTERLRTEKADPLIGTVLSERYSIKKKVGEGGMGMIYLAEDERLGKDVVVKMLPPWFAGRTELAQRFVQEAKVTSQMQHENIVFITDLVVTSPPFYVMEYLKGEELGTIIYKDGRMTWDERTKDILTQVCRALGAAHDKGVIHRDMKPGNIFIVEHSDGREFVKILDFGIAKLIFESSREEKGSEGTEAIGKARTGMRNLTNIGTVLGTPVYMAPEQGQGKEIDHRADIYSIGIIMYEMLTGSVPFDIPGRAEMDAENSMKIMEMHCNDPVVPPSVRRPEASIPEDVDAIIMKALRKAPEERYASILEVEAALLKCPAPKHKPKAKIIHDETMSQIRSAEGLLRIRGMEAARRKNAKIRAAALAVAITAAAAAGIAATSLIPGSQPVAGSGSAQESGEAAAKRGQTSAPDGK